MRPLTLASLFAAASLAVTVASAAPVDVHPSGDTTNNTWISGVSADGLTSVGRTTIGPGVTDAFKLVGTTYTALNPFTGHSNAVATAASADGTLVVGFSIDMASYTQAVSWTGSSATLLDFNNNFLFSEATGVSADGTLIVGWGFNGTTAREEFVFWENGITYNYGNVVGGGLASRATGVSSDGTIMVGTLADNFGSPMAMSGFVYVRGVGSSLVQADANIAAFATANLSFTQLTGVSGNGQIVVGFASSGLNSGDEQAFKYDRVGSTYAALGSLGAGTWSIARAVNNDGSVIVGQSSNGTQDEAFVYQNGAMTGLGFLPGGSSSNATGVSADGSVVVGYGDVAGGFIHAFTYANQTLLDATEWMRSLNGPGSLSAMANNLSNLPLEGAHHRPLMSYDAMGKQTQVWATGDFGASSRQTDRRTSYGEVGASQAYGDTVVGVAVGTALQTQDLLFGGDAKVTGQTFLAEIDTRLADKESILSLLVMRGEWDARTARGYVTGGGNDISRGQTDLSTTTVRVRYDGPTQKFISSMTAAPFASFALTRVRADAFAESGGSFPATFDAHTHTAKESRLGLLTKFDLGAETTLRVTAEWIHRFDDAGDALSGISQTTSGAFSVAGLAPTKDQARFGLDVDHKLSANTLLSFSVHAAGYGQAHDVAGSLSLRRGF
ncbi:MAG: autotransporter domain-containing protein [Opitutales bacterium]